MTPNTTQTEPVDPLIKRDADLLQYGGADDPRVRREVDRLFEAIPPRSGQTVGRCEDDARRLQMVLAQTSAPAVRAEILRRLDPLLNFVPKQLVEDQAAK